MHRPVADPASSTLESLLVRFAAMVRGIGRRHRLSESDVDEVFQDVRIRLWKASERGEQIGAKPTSYVYKTAMSAATDLVRRRRRARAESLDDGLTSWGGGAADVPAAAVDGESVEGRVMVSELVQRVVAAVDTLAPARRPVVRMHLAGYDREEIASFLGWSEAKTRNLLYRGLADLRERLTAQGIGPEAR
jgi:RNA polymerase sigma-70 factor (ECF subfamily)